MKGYEAIIRGNLEKLFSGVTSDLAYFLPAEERDGTFTFNAFGGVCRIGPGSISLDGKIIWDALGIIISLYALHASPEQCTLEPVRAFRDFPGSMPYAGAFATHTENILIPHAGRIEKAHTMIMEALNGDEAPAGTGGDLSFILRPLPKITLCYILYREDEEFPASVTCLFSGNADAFLPLDALADVGEYTSKKILELIA